MAGMRVSIRKIREVLRLTHELGLSVRKACEATGVGKTAVNEYVSRARVIGITWPIPSEIDDAELERRLFVPAGFHKGPTRVFPDWNKVHEELKRRGVPLRLLWEEHRAELGWQLTIALNNCTAVARVFSLERYTDFCCTFMAEV